MFQKNISVILIFLLPLMGFTSPRLSHAQEKQEYTIAVVDLDAKGISQAETDYLSEYMRGQVTRLVTSEEYKERTGINYTVVERSQMDRIFEQFEIQDTGCTDISCAVEFGKILSVERILIGSVGLVGQTYSISTRIVDVESAGTIAVADYTYAGQIDDLLRTGVSNVVDELMYGQKKKSHRSLYIIAGITIAAGIAAYLLIPDEKENTGSISIRIPVPQD